MNKRMMDRKDFNMKCEWVLNDMDRNPIKVKM